MAELEEEKKDDFQKAFRLADGEVGDWIAPEEEVAAEEEEVVQEEAPQEEVVQEEVVQEEVPQEEVIQEEVVAEEKPRPNLDPEVEAFLKFKEETGRGFADFNELQKDWSKENGVEVLRKYIAEKNSFFDEEDIDDEIDTKYMYDSDEDEESTIKHKKREYKKDLAEAIAYFEGQKEKYKTPLASNERSTADYDERTKKALESLDSFEKFQKESDEARKISEKQYEVFTKKTNDVFNNDFKGFEFSIGEDKKVFEVVDKEKVKGFQSDLSNFINKFLDKDGYIADANAYHKAIHTAMNADKIAEHFYELGKAEALAKEVKDSKNINMSNATVKESPTGTPMLKFL